MYDFSVASKMGYGQSKLISECLLDQAAKISGVRSACCRVGIVAGPVEKRAGLWNKHEYIPSVGFPFISPTFIPYSSTMKLVERDQLRNLPQKDLHLLRRPPHLPFFLPLPRPHRLVARGQAL